MKPFASCIHTLLFGACLTALLAPASAMAESQCKGLTEANCAEAAHCRWIDGYVRKDGREVAGYCRVLHRSKAPQEPVVKLGSAD